MKSSLVFFFATVILIPLVLGEPKEVLLGKQAEITCEYTGSLEGRALVVSLNYVANSVSKEVRLAYLKQSGFNKNNFGSDAFMKGIKGVQVKNAPKNGVTLEIEEVPESIDESVYKCTVYDNDGLGSEIWATQSTIKVVDPPKITLEPNEKVIKRAKDSKEDIVVTCKATGRPQPTLKWMRNDKEIASVKDKDGVKMTLKGPITVDTDGDYDCVAQVESKRLKTEKLSEAKETVRVSVQYKPTLKIDRGTIYTDLDQRETLTIDVSGNPQPQLNCSMLQLPEPKTIRLTPYSTQHRLVYEVTILKVKERDIRDYECKAWNDQGSVSDMVKLTLKPSTPKILSSNSSSYSDYYLLHWSVKSRAPMRNVSVEVLVRTENSTKLIRTDVFKLAPNSRTFNHHIANLTDNAVHELRLRACNSRGCGDELVTHAFRTQAYDGTNTVDPMIVKIPVTVTPIRSDPTTEKPTVQTFKVGKNIQDQGNLASTVSPLPWVVILLSALLTFNH